ncbi:MAG: LysM peptidoglycan-binding domain-containing protein [Actinomycetota bacterium]
MSTLRSAAALAAALAALAVLIRFPTAGPSLLERPTGFVGWWETHGTAEAAIGMLHLATLAGAAYVVAVLAAVTLAAALRVPRAAESIARLAPRSIRRHLVAGVVAGVLMAPATAIAQEPIVVIDIGAEASTESTITLTDLGETAPDHREPRDPDRPTERSEPSEPPVSDFRESFRAGPVAATPDAWLVESGDNLWTIAATVVRDQHGEPADEASVARYWRSLISANARTLDDPDLIHPGQVLTLPPVVTAGS